MHRYLTLLLFLAIALGGGLTIGYLTVPGDWYAGLTKPSFNPPGWVFGPVWTLLYITIAVAGWWVWENGVGGWTKALWCAQLVLNFSWSPVFFVAHRIDLALVIIVILLVTIISFIVTTWRKAKFAALLLIPYALWVAFASVLNASIFLLN